MCNVCVVIPARDEAAGLDRTLAALARQTDLVGRPHPRSTYEIIVLANNCRDDTATIARRVAARHPDLALHVAEVDLAPDEAHVGCARRLLMDEACRRLLLNNRPRGIIASTDADTVVAPTWIAAISHGIGRGAEAVGGRIYIDPAERAAMEPQLRRRFLRNVGYYALVCEVEARLNPCAADPWPRHDQFFGASLALTAETYHRVGGIPVLPANEDVALARALRRADIKRRHSPAVRVWTSARLVGRTPAGLASQLSIWSAMTGDADVQEVPAPRTVVARASFRRSLRVEWLRTRSGHGVCTSEVARLAAVAGVSAAWLADALASPGPYGAVLDDVEERGTWPGLDGLADVRDAIPELRAWLAPYRRVGAAPPGLASLLSGRPATLPPLEEIQPIRPFAPPPQVA